MTEEQTKSPASWKRRTALAGLAVGALAVAGAGVAAVAGDHHHGGPGFFGPMGGPGPHGFMENVKGDFMEFRMNKMLDKVDASDDQKKQIKAIFDKARETVDQQRGEPGDMRKQMVALLKAPTIDRSAVETMRAEGVAKMENVSRIMSTALVDAASVLTPDQRAKLATEMESHGPRW